MQRAASTPSGAAAGAGGVADAQGAATAAGAGASSAAAADAPAPSVPGLRWDDIPVPQPTPSTHLMHVHHSMFRVLYFPDCINNIN